nr:hypothetical protein [Hahella sp. CCB-MM4]
MPNVHGTDAVKKAGVCRSWEDIREDVILANISKALKKRVVKDSNFLFEKGDASMNRVHD